MSKVSIWQAKTNLSQLIQKALNGEEVIISKRDKSLVKLVPIKGEVKKRLLGLFEGKIWMSDDFNEIPEDFEEYL